MKVKKRVGTKARQNGPFSIPNRTLATAALVLFASMLVLHLHQAGSSQELILGGNERTHVRLLHSMVVERTFSIGPRGVDASYYDGRYYSNKPPGYAFFMTPAYAAYVKMTGASHVVHAPLFLKRASAMLSAATIVCVFLFLATFPLSRVSVAFGVIAVAFGTIFPAYSWLANSIPLSLLLCTAAILFLRLSRLQPLSSVYRGAALFCAAYAVTADYSNALFLLPIFIIVLVDAARHRDVWSLVPATVPVALLLCYNAFVFDHPLALSYSYYRPPQYVPWSSAGNALSVANMPRGFYGLLLSPSRGMFLISPITLLGVVALWTAMRERRWDLLWLGKVVLVGTLAMSAYSLWHGGHSIGYRHILVAAVVLAMLSAFAFERANRSLRGAALVILLVSSVTGFASFLIELDDQLLMRTWKEEPADVHANFYSELLYPWVQQHLR